MFFADFFLSMVANNSVELEHGANFIRNSPSLVIYCSPSYPYFRLTTTANIWTPTPFTPAHAVHAG